MNLAHNAAETLGPIFPYRTTRPQYHVRWQENWIPALKGGMPLMAVPTSGHEIEMNRRSSRIGIGCMQFPASVLGPTMGLVLKSRYDNR